MRDERQQETSDIPWETQASRVGISCMSELWNEQAIVFELTTRTEQNNHSKSGKTSHARRSLTVVGRWAERLRRLTGFFLGKRCWIDAKKANLLMENETNSKLVKHGGGSGPLPKFIHWGEDKVLARSTVPLPCATQVAYNSNTYGRSP